MSMYVHAFSTVMKNRWPHVPICQKKHEVFEYQRNERGETRKGKGLDNKPNGVKFMGEMLP
jgi:hypothetical protein